MSFDELGGWMRDVLKRVDDLERRASSTVMTGQVKSVEGDKAVVEFDAKDAVTGKPFASPPLRIASATGTIGLTLARHSLPAIGETVGVLSPSGELGPHSRVIPFGPTDANRGPGKGPADGDVTTFGAGGRIKTYQKQITEEGTVIRHGPSKTGATMTMKKSGRVVLTAGDDPKTERPQLNEQLKGLASRTAQLEHGYHALFDVTSRLREIAQAKIPGLAVLEHILNKQPEGLDAMVEELGERAQEYLQKQFEQALAKFVTPNLAGLASLVSGAVQGAIATVQGQVTALIAANPVVAQALALRADIADLIQDGPAGVVADHIADLQGQLDDLIANNPLVAAADALQATLDDLIEQAAPAASLLGLQQQLVQGVTKSMRLG